MSKFQKGNTAAVKRERPATSHVHIRVPPELKDMWISHAKNENTTLSDWIIKTLALAENSH